MIEVGMAIAVASGVIAVFLTMGPGQRLVKRLGLRRLQKGAAPEEDRAFLLQACGGDRAAVEARLDAERMRYPDWDEARLYRRAIRVVMNETRRSGDDDAADRDASDRPPDTRSDR